MRGAAEAAGRLDERCRRAEYEHPRLAAPDGTVAVAIGDLRLLLNACAAYPYAIAERVMQAHEWGYRDPVEGGFVVHDLPFELALAVLAQGIETRSAETAQQAPSEG